MIPLNPLQEFYYRCIPLVPILIKIVSCSSSINAEKDKTILCNSFMCLKNLEGSIYDKIWIGNLFLPLVLFINAEFPAAAISNCLFHLGQSSWRCLQLEGITQENHKMRAQFHSLIALAFVFLRTSFDKLKQMV